MTARKRSVSRTRDDSESGPYRPGEYHVPPQLGITRAEADQDESSQMRKYVSHHLDGDRRVPLRVYSLTAE